MNPTYQPKDQNALHTLLYLTTYQFISVFATI